MSTETRNSETFVCRQCGCEVPSHFQLRTEGRCYLCDPAINIEELLADEPFKVSCVDGGACHHGCQGNSRTDCFRRRACSPRSGYQGAW